MRAQKDHPLLTRADIVSALQEVGHRALQAGVLVDLAVYGGSAIALQWEFRRQTRDIDVIIQSGSVFVRQAAQAIAAERGWPVDWLNDAVKGFASEYGEHQMYEEYLGDAQNVGLRVFVPTAEYLLAMKCMAMRIGDQEGHDASDIQYLMADIGVKTVDAVMAIVEKYYPQQRIQPKTYYGIQEILGTLIDHEHATDSSTPPGPR